MGETSRLSSLLHCSSGPALCSLHRRLTTSPQFTIINSKPLCRHPVRREVFLEEFWKCFNRLEDTADEMVGKAAYFRFLTLLGAASICSPITMCKSALHAVLGLANRCLEHKSMSCGVCDLWRHDCRPADIPAAEG